MPRRSRIALSLLLVVVTGFQSSAEQPLPDGFLGKYVWRERFETFGGWSGIEVLAGGREFVALGDRASLVAGSFRRDTAGVIVGLTASPMRPLRDQASGSALGGRRADSEGLAINDSGMAFVSFENRPRVMQLDLTSGMVADLALHPDFADLPRNGALEALAISDGLTLYAVPEDTLGPDIAVYRWRGGLWDKELSLPRRGSFLPVAADVLDGRLYLLEREFRGIGGFASRLRRFDISETGLAGETLLITTPPAMFDNLEGLSVWRNADGDLRATMISDDNFFMLQQTQIVEFRLAD